MTYSIIRVYQDFRLSETIKTGLSLEEAQEHCQNPDTAGEGWMDVFRKE